MSGCEEFVAEVTENAVTSMKDIKKILGDDYDIFVDMLDDTADENETGNYWLASSSMAVYSDCKKIYFATDSGEYLILYIEGDDGDYGGYVDFCEELPEGIEPLN